MKYHIRQVKEFEFCSEGMRRVFFLKKTDMIGLHFRKITLAAVWKINWQPITVNSARNCKVPGISSGNMFRQEKTEFIDSS